MKIRLDRSFATMSISGYMLDGDEYVESLNKKKIKPYEYMSPTFNLDDTQAQELMDDLWRCGIRPTEGKGSAGQLTAVQYHLEDMRKLVFKEKL